MSSESSSKDPVITAVVHDPSHDEANLHEASSAPGHSQEEEIAHAWQHFFSDCRMFAIFFCVIVLTVVTWGINFGPTGNFIFVGLTAAMRSALIAYYMLTLFKQFTLVKRTFIFSLIFLIGMIFLSLWDSEVMPGKIGDPIYDWIHPESMKQN